MKKFTLFLTFLLCVVYIAVAQLKLYVYQDSIPTEFVVSTVDVEVAQLKLYVYQDSILAEFDASTVDSLVFSISESLNTPQVSGLYRGYEYVDLALPSGTLWARKNVGAEFPEDYGDYFAWGEVQAKYTYDWSTYKWCEGSYDTQTKYCVDSDYGIFDSKMILDYEDDVANVKWGGSWRIPSREQIEELRTECVWIWTVQNGVNGYKISSNRNGNSIFLPAAGRLYKSDSYISGVYGCYWSRSVYYPHSWYAYYLFFNSSDVSKSSLSRDQGFSVRPVFRK